MVRRPSPSFLEQIFTRQERRALGFVAVVGILGLFAQAAGLARRAPAPAPGAGEVAVNRAGVPELISLPGIGPVLARRIVEDRRLHGRFLTLGDLRRVRGISKQTLRRLKGYVRFD